MKNPYQSVVDFEQSLAEFTGSPYAVAVDCCTNALFLCCYYLKVQEVTIPKHTYVSVPCSIIQSGGKVKFEQNDWLGAYQLKPYPIYDSACQISKNMYIPGTYQCLSFGINKILQIGRGGMILTDNVDAVNWFKLARYSGRKEIPYLEDNFTMLGWNMILTPEQATRGLSLLSHLPEKNIISKNKYPDLSKFEVYNGN